MKKFILILVAIIAVALLEFVALSKGINGHVMALSFAIIGSLATGGTIKIKDILGQRKANHDN